ncbi:carbohydrate ABC transporter permease [Treponema brennaborense]|uniref:ABC-type transporter, integral membrane subunit n=1 Tax=Treponema brennaborense (strain DSM 12168 / CIP 105900 / DD5/3) TaxID=906968 RepID=F4LPB9_TREBD|nr:carbohydrate ABC transporter permease [Treponema brennaborense]AEE16981.1 ABC-type transporter, integral membrane subunit [Treponema brennaborense DSM 12168]
MLKNTVTEESLYSRVNGIFLCILSFLFLYPLLYVFSASLSRPIHILMGDVVLLPKSLTFDAYKEAFRIPLFWRSYVNTVGITLVGTAVNMFFTVSGAYMLSKKNLKGRTFFTLMVILIMWFDPGMIPRYLNFRSLGLINTYTSVTLGFAISTFNLIILKSFFESVPASLEESARIDGANQLQIMLKIHLPLSGAALSTVSVFYAVSRWNGYFWSMILLTDDKKAPLQVLLKKLIVEQNMNADAGSLITGGSTSSPETVIYAVIILSIVPVLLSYPYIQRFFKKGVMLGSVKG